MSENIKRKHFQIKHVTYWSDHKGHDLDHNIRQHKGQSK